MYIPEPLLWLVIAFVWVRVGAEGIGEFIGATFVLAIIVAACWLCTELVEKKNERSI